MIAPAVRAERDVMAAVMVAAIDQHIAHAELAQLAEGDLGGVGRHRWRYRPISTLVQLGKFVTFTTLPVAS